MTKAKKPVTDKRFKKKRGPGRPVGTANNDKNFLQTQKINFRCTEGFKDVLHILSNPPYGKKGSASDVMHRALKMYATSLLTDPEEVKIIATII